MKHIQRVVEIAVLGLAAILMSVACIPVFSGIRSLYDLDAPALLSVDQTSAGALSITFSETIEPLDGQFYLASDQTGASPPSATPGISEIETRGDTLIVGLEHCDEPGWRYMLCGEVTDESGNSLWFMFPFYGYNPNPAELVLSEFINENSSTRYEKVEFLVTVSGNLGGLTVYDGASKNHRSVLSFASQEVTAGEYVVVHFRRGDGTPEEIGEIQEYGDGAENLAFSNQATADVRDFWADGEQGISDTNGAISLYASPRAGSRVLDAVLFSNRSYDPDASYGSFGTSYTEDVMNELADAGAWVFANETIRPDDCLRTEDSTSTRSLNRYFDRDDSDSATDWYICATGESSFGLDNSTLEYE